MQSLEQSFWNQVAGKFKLLGSDAMQRNARQWYCAVTFVVRWKDMAMIHQKTKPSCHYLNWTLGRNKFQHNKGRPWMGVTTIDRVVNSSSQHNWWHNRFHITTGGTRIIDPVPDSDQWIMEVSGSNVSFKSFVSTIKQSTTHRWLVDQVLTGHSKRSCSSSWTSVMIVMRSPQPKSMHKFRWYFRDSS